MTLDQALAAVLDALEGAGIPYMILGAWASGVHGVARATHDTDVVVQATPAQFERFARLLGRGSTSPFGRGGPGRGAGDERLAR